MDIGGFDIKRKLFSNDFGLIVFEVEEMETGRTFILRLVDFSNKSTDFKKSQWNQLQNEYPTVISDYSHLPRIEQVAKVDEDHLFSLFDGEEGGTLSEKGPLGPDQIQQLIIALRHLHNHQMIHGSISPENIWITNQGRVILYGTGEAKVLEGKPRLGAVSDIRQLTAVIQHFSTLSEPILEKLNLEEPMTVEELEQILFRPERKAGISEDNKLAAFFERKSITQKAESAERERRKAEKGKHRKANKMIIGGVIAAMMILAVYFLF